jgi:hypothetical protein
MATSVDTLIDFVNKFKNDEDLHRLPLPQSVMNATGINYKLKPISIAEACNRAIFAPNNYDSVEEIKPDPDAFFPDLTKLGDEYKKQYLIEEASETDSTICVVGQAKEENLTVIKEETEETEDVESLNKLAA